jgi:dienelactone hydrolase
MWRRTATAAAGLALALGACGGDDPPAAPVESSPAPRAEPVRFPASDGEPVDGIFRPAGTGAPAVLLVNGLVGGVAQWDAFVPHLHDAGFATLAYDGRGGVDVTALAEEVGGAVAFLRGRPDVDPRRLGIVGASVGGSTALLAVAGPERRRLQAAVALSPRAAPALLALKAERRYHPRHVLFLSDQREQATVEPLTRGALDSRSLVSEMTGHGVALLESVAYRRVVLDWLEQHLG